MKNKRIYGILLIVLAGLLLAVAILSSVYEISSYAAYVETLPEEEKGAAFGILVVIILLVFSVPFATAFGIFTLIVGIKALRGNVRKGEWIATVISKCIIALGCAFLAAIYMDLYLSAGWLSKSVYLLTCALALATLLFDCIVKKDVLSPTLTENAIAENDATTETVEE